MLNLSQTAELKTLQPRKEWEGDDHVLAVTFKLLFEEVPVESIQDGLVGNYSAVYKKDALVFEDVQTFEVLRTIKNVDVTVDEQTLQGADIDSIEVTPLTGRISIVALKVKARCSSAVTGYLHSKLHEQIPVRLTQRQLELVE